MLSNFSVEMLKEIIANNPELKNKLDQEKPEWIFQNMDTHPDGIFSYKAKDPDISRLWYKKANNKWEWTCYNPFDVNGNEDVFIPVSQLIVPTGIYTGFPPAPVNILFIDYLNIENPAEPNEVISKIKSSYSE